MAEWHWLAFAVVLASGAALFLTLVAKETRRRSSCLQLRFERALHELELERNRRTIEARGRPRRSRRSATAAAPKEPSAVSVAESANPAASR